MRTRGLTIFLTAAVLVVSALVFLYFLDRSRANVIAESVSVGGVEIGNLDADIAKRKLRRELGKSLLSPVVVSHEKRSAKLWPKSVDLEMGLASMVDGAVDRSREGGLFGRSWRYLTGGSVDEDLPVKVSFSERELDRWISRFRKKVEHPARDASVSYSANSVSLTPERNGVSFHKDRLKKSIKSELVAHGGDRRVGAPGRVLKPKVTRAQLRGSVPWAITVDRTGKKLSLWKNFKLSKTYTIAVGQVGYETDAGLYEVQNKQVDPPWTPPDSDWVSEDMRGKTVPGGSPENPLKARWLGFNGAAGIHGTDNIGSLGTAASHGCIRMSIPDVKELYAKVGVGAPVFIG